MRIWGWRMTDFCEVRDGCEHPSYGVLGHRYHVGILSVWGRCVFTSCALLFSGVVSKAEQLVEHQTNAALSAFYGFCLTDEFDATKVASFAKNLGWGRIPENQMRHLVPKTEVEYQFFDGYVFLSPDDPPVPMAVFSGLEVAGNEEVHHCSFFFRDVHVNEFTSGFIEDSGATFLSDDGPIGAIAEFYQLAEFPKSLVLIESEKRNTRGLRASFLLRKPKGSE